jgi:hypothetical protein
VTDHIDQEELNGFMAFCYEQIQALRDHLLQGGSPGAQATESEG